MIRNRKPHQLRRRRGVLSWLMGALVAPAILCASSAGGQPPWVRAEKDWGGRVILDTHSYWRAHVTLRPTVFGTQKDAQPRFTKEGEAERLKSGRSSKPRRWQARAVLPPDGPRSPLPAADWMKPEFDDSRWWRDPGPFFGYKTGQDK